MKPQARGVVGDLGGGREAGKPHVRDLNEAIRRGLESAFPRWGVLASDQGRWWATRGPLDRTQLKAGCEGALDADTPGRLCARLAEESARDEERPGRWTW